MQANNNKAWRTVADIDVLPPDRASKSRAASTPRRLDVEDAVFEVLAGPGRTRSNDNRPKYSGTSQFSPAASVLAAMFRMGGALSASLESWLLRLSPQAFTCLLSAAVVAIFGMFGGFGALSGQTADLRAGPYLVSNLRISTRDLDGMRVAEVEGELVNDGAAVLVTPVLELVGGPNRTRLGKISIDADRIAPSIRFPFSGRFQIAGSKAEDLTILIALR
ncbi:hypothetical protein [Rhizobium sp. FKL33]|uniref:hypothetical protein n=1 Tax=Rhizobium sp. FKL33 TaxID=2562307 RepID=UPI0010C03F59|nr:hypothetical protein [Rhizobium sp. FKL33]